MEYKNEIKSIFKDGICKGFMARRSVVVGIAQGIDDGWMITQSITNPKWTGNYRLRKEAKNALFGSLSF